MEYGVLACIWHLLPWDTDGEAAIQKTKAAGQRLTATITPIAHPVMGSIRAGCGCTYLNST